MIDEAADMKAGRHAAGARELLSHNGARATAQVDTHNPHPLAAHQPLQIVLQGGLTASQHHIEDTMPLQVAEGCGVAILLRKEVLIDAQYAGANTGLPLGGLTDQEVQEPALDCGTANRLAPGDTAATGSVPMTNEDAVAKWFGGP